jgi:hypothetical protein
LGVTYDEVKDEIMLFLPHWVFVDIGAIKRAIPAKCRLVHWHCTCIRRTAFNLSIHTAENGDDFEFWVKTHWVWCGTFQVIITWPGRHLLDEEPWREIIVTKRPGEHPTIAMDARNAYGYRD